MDAQTAEVQALRLIAGSNPMCGTGAVKNFKLDPKGGYGFIVVEGSENIIFHGTRGVVPFFSGDDNPGLFPWNPRKNDVPQMGNHILYAAEVTPKGMRAVAWSLWRPAEWRAIGALIEARPLYRLMRRKGPRIQSTKFKVEGHGFQTIWEGKNPMMAPRTRLINREDEAIYFLEYQPSTQQWVETDYDPRFRMQELEFVEAAQ